MEMHYDDLQLPKLVLETNIEPEIRCGIVWTLQTLEQKVVSI